MTVMHYALIQWRVRKIAVYRRLQRGGRRPVVRRGGLDLPLDLQFARCLPHRTGVMHSLVWCLRADLAAMLVHTVINKTFMILAMQGIGSAGRHPQNVLRAASRSTTTWPSCASARW